MNLNRCVVAAWSLGIAGWMGVAPATTAWAQTEPAAPAKPEARPHSNLPAGVKRVRDITYAEVPGRALKLDLYLPEEVEGAPAKTPPPHPPHSPRPVVMWIHGGGWEMGDKEQCPAHVLVAHGYSVVSVGYRLSGVAPFPAQINDCKAAVRWVRAHASEHGFDPDRIGVWGASAGGHLSALLGTSAGVAALEGTVGNDLKESSRVQAVCDWFGPTDLVKLCRLSMSNGEDDGTKGTFEKDGTRNGKLPKTPPLFRKLFGGELNDKLDIAASANPIAFVDKDDAPVLIMHGDKDPLVPLVQSEELVTALKAAGVEVELHVVKDGGHGFWNQELVDKIVAFFDAHLKKKP